jgi:hypothetical protein
MVYGCLQGPVKCPPQALRQSKNLGRSDAKSVPAFAEGAEAGDARRSHQRLHGAQHERPRAAAASRTVKAGEPDNGSHESDRAR